MFVILHLIPVLSCIIYQIRVTSLETAPTVVLVEKGGDVTFTCGIMAQNIVDMDLISQSETIKLCDAEAEVCPRRYYRKGACDVIIRDLTFSDARTYILRVYEVNDKTFHLHIKDEIDVHVGMLVNLDILLSDAEKVEKSVSGLWELVWSRTHGVQSDRLDANDVNLIIKAFIASDAGTYRVLDSKGETWITVRVTESTRSGQTGNRGKDEEETDHSGVHQPLEAEWIVAAVVLPITIIFICFIMKIY